MGQACWQCVLGQGGVDGGGQGCAGQGDEGGKEGGEGGGECECIGG